MEAGLDYVGTRGFKHLALGQDVLDSIILGYFAPGTVRSANGQSKLQL